MENPQDDPREFAHGEDDHFTEDIPSPGLDTFLCEQRFLSNVTHRLTRASDASGAYGGWHGWSFRRDSRAPALWVTTGEQRFY